MSSTKSTQIDGDVSVGRDVAIGGRVTVQGSSHLKGNVKVEGWLDARNIKSPCKGLFASAEALAKAYPYPKNGWWALVGDTLPADVYRAEDGAWVATGEQSGEENLDLNQLVEDVSGLKEKVASLEESIGSESEEISNINTAISNINSSVSSLNESVSDLKDRVSEIEQTVATNTSDIAGVRSESSQLSSTVTNVGTRVDTLEEGQSELETDLRVAEKDIVNAQSDITDLQNAVWPLAVSFSASSTLLEYTGEAKSVTLSWSVTRNGSAVTPDSVVITYGNNVEVYSGTDSSGSVATSLNLSGARTFTITVTSGSLTATSTVTVRMLPPIYIGFYEEQTLGGELTFLGNKYTKTSIAGTYEVTQDIAGGGYLWICSPDFVGTVSRVTLNGFNVPMLDGQTVVTDLATYYCYCSYNMLTAGTYTFVIE